MSGDFAENREAIAAAKRQKLIGQGICLGLILITFIVYAQVAQFDFIIYDDGPQVYKNAHVQAGLTLASVKWAFKCVVLGNWMPVTLLSHIVDTQLFGMQSGLHHLVNVLFHAMAACLLFAALRRATGEWAPSAFVAFLFALHPLHVGSVAWISERKDVLGAVFWFLALYGYVRYAENPTRGRYDVMVAVSFCLGLMSKPMLVTLPFTLLLFDVWPLRRTRWPATLWEKLPLFTLSAISAIVTYFVQGSAGALTTIPPATRIANALISYCTYIRQMFWPLHLSVFYPYPHLIPAWKAWVAAAVILGLSTLAILAWRTRPYFAVGWFWYLGTMVPVIGLVQAGMQAHADRYMYVPMVGLLVMLGWGGAEIAARWPWTKRAIATLAVVSCVACVPLAWNEVAYWQNDQTLFARAIEVTEDNWVAENDLGAYLYRQGQNADAIRHFENVLRVEPNYVAAQNNLGAALLELEGCPAAIPHFQKALQLDPTFVDADNNLGKCELMSENYAAAIPYLEAVVREQPDRPEGHTGLGLAFSNIPGHTPDAIREFEAASLLAPDDPRIHVSLGTLLAGIGRTQEAIVHLEAAQFIRPDPAVSKLLDRLRSESR